MTTPSLTDSDPARVLIVDDNPGAREALRSVLLAEGYELFEAGSGAEALSMAVELQPDVVLLDIMMPDMDGTEVCRVLREKPEISEIPVVMVTALDDRESRLQATWSGADDFLTKPIDREEVRARVRTIVRLNRYRRLILERERVDLLIDRAPDGIVLTDVEGRIVLANPEMYFMLGLPRGQGSLEGQSIWPFLDGGPTTRPKVQLEALLAHQIDRASFEARLQAPSEGRSFPVQVNAVRFPVSGGTGLQLDIRDVTDLHLQMETIRQLNRELLTAYDATLRGWVSALDLRHKETEGHTQRVTTLTVALCRALGFDDDATAHARRGALLHDIGKLAIPDRILVKEGPLTEEERGLMQQHPVYAWEWLRPIEFLEPALPIPRWHHERWDGSGYPDRLAGEKIPRSARIFALADVWDALRSDRVYRKALGRDEVVAHMRSGAGTHFDPELVELFLDVASEQEELPCTA